MRTTCADATAIEDDLAKLVVDVQNSLKKSVHFIDAKSDAYTPFDEMTTHQAALLDVVDTSCLRRGASFMSEQDKETYSC